MSHRSRRSQDRPDYAALHHGKARKTKYSHSSSEDDNDISGEHDLVEDDQDYLDMEANEEDEFLEEGEISSESEEDVELERTIKKLTKEGNVKKLRELVQINKNKCKKLKQEIELEQKCEKDRELKEVLDELQKVKKKKNDLERSLASSRTSTPRNSPRRNKNARSKKETKQSATPLQGKKGHKSTKTRKSTTDEEKSRANILLVDNVATNFHISNFRLVMIPRDSGFCQLAEDIHKGILRLSQYGTVVIIGGRAEVVNGRHVKAALNKLIHALCTFGKKTDFIFVGPLPHMGDSKYLVRDLMYAGTQIKQRIENLPGFRFCDASAWFADRNGVDSSRFEGDRISPKGCQLLREKVLRLVGRNEFNY